MKPLVNMTALRSEALERLKRYGSQPFSYDEAWYVGCLLRQSLGFDPKAGETHPLYEAACYELQELEIGKWEFVLQWLSPYHDGSRHPQIVTAIAMYLLGHEAMDGECRQRLSERKRKSGV